jgi:hypothetical protein
MIGQLNKNQWGDDGRRSVSNRFYKSDSIGLVLDWDFFNSNRLGPWSDGYQIAQHE